MTRSSRKFHTAQQKYEADSLNIEDSLAGHCPEGAVLAPQVVDSLRLLTFITGFHLGKN